MDSSGQGPAHPARHEDWRQRGRGADPGPGGAEAAARLRAVQALALMRAEADGAVSIARIAERLGVGMRCLQLAFAAHYGMTPREMLTTLRLEKARSLLLAAAPEATVTTIALDAGFSHLSRFSESYRRAFGECPVETLRRRRAAPDRRAAG